MKLKYFDITKKKKKKKKHRNILSFKIFFYEFSYFEIVV